VTDPRAAASAASPGLRPAAPGDLEPLHRLARSALREPWTRAALRDALRRPGDRTWCALDAAGTLQGFVLAERVADELHVLGLAVAPERRGCGLGGRLLARSLAAAREEGVRAVHLEARADNRAARALYARRGFRVVGRRRRYYADGADALLLSLELTAAPRAADGRA